jgi:hypothetical protein
MNEVFDVIENDATAVDALEDVMESLAGQAEMLACWRGEGLGYKEQELVGKLEDHVTEARSSAYMQIPTRMVVILEGRRTRCVCLCSWF